MTKDITPQELKKRIEEQDNDFVLIDVREPEEHAEFNIGGELIPLGDLMGRLGDLQETLEEKEVITYCRTGRRSAMAKSLLEQGGLKQVRNLEGGMVAWKELEV